MSESGGESRAAEHRAIEAWNVIAARYGLPACRMLTGARRSALAARLRDPDWAANYPAALAGIERSAFLRGGNARDWRASIDWFLRPNSVTRILEGQYEERPQIGGGAQKEKISSLAADWMLRAHWVGGRRVVEDALRFALLECGNDAEFIQRQVEKVEERAKPWLWREACRSAFKFSLNAPRQRAERFPGPTSISAPLSKIAGEDRAARQRAEQRFHRIRDHLRRETKTEITLWGLGRINRYRVVQGEKTGGRRSSAKPASAACSLRGI